MILSININKIVNCLCGEYSDIPYEKINKLSQNNCIIENTMRINNQALLDEYDIIHSKDIKDL